MVITKAQQERKFHRIFIKQIVEMKGIWKFSINLFSIIFEQNRKKLLWTEIRLYKNKKNVN